MNLTWDQRYASGEYMYGIKPNSYFAGCLHKLTPGRICLPADGEGRNAVWAASQGWQVEAFDQSSVAREKALDLAYRQEVKISYQVLNFEKWQPGLGVFDCIALIFVHLMPNLRESVYSKVFGALKAGGHLIIESFSQKQLLLASGGPKVPEMLCNAGQLAKYFSGMDIIQLEETRTLLDEGPLHQGLAEVVRFFAKKKN